MSISKTRTYSEIKLIISETNTEGTHVCHTGQQYLSSARTNNEMSGEKISGVTARDSIGCI